MKMTPVFNNFFNEPTSALNLAIFRIVIFVFLLFSTDFAQVDRFLSFSPDLIDPASGIAWLSPLLLSAADTQLLVILYKIFCTLAIFGLFTRCSALIATLLGIYLLGIPHLFGKIYHEHQNLIWFGLLLAASPCGDVWSLDALIKKHWRKNVLNSIDTLSRIYTVPLRFVWLLLAVVYFFPGIAKLRTGGLEWIFSDNLKILIHDMSLKSPDIPLVWIFDSVYFTILAAFCVVFFEVTFIFAIFFRTTRYLYAVGGILFHSLIHIMIGFPFYQLRICYVGLLDWYSFLPDRHSHIKEETPRTRRQFYTTIATGSFLVLINGTYGMTNSWGWPFTAYPSMNMNYKSGQATPHPQFSFVALDTDGKNVDISKDLEAFINKLRRTRWKHRQRVHLLPNNEAERKRELRLVWNELLKANPLLKDVHQLQLYRSFDSNAEPQLLTAIDDLAFGPK